MACTGRGGLDHDQCRYGNSRLAFRGPKRDTDGRYVACLGGIETFGRFVPAPWPEQLERRLGLPCVNLGVVNAGLDAFLGDPAVLDLAQRAETRVLQIGGAHMLSNRFYTVHPRRNDRFVRASEALVALYPEVDFSEHVFTRALCSALHRAAPERFALVVEELQAAWVARTRRLMSMVGNDVVLLWCGRAAPPATADPAAADRPGRDPLFVTQAMIEALAPQARATVIAVRSAEAAAAGTDGMVFSEFEAVAAGQLLGAAAHGEIAETLAHALYDDVQGAAEAE